MIFPQLKLKSYTFRPRIRGSYVNIHQIFKRHRLSETLGLLLGSLSVALNKHQS